MMFILVHETQTFWENRKPITDVAEYLVNLDNVEDIKREADGRARIVFASSYIITNETFEEIKSMIGCVAVVRGEEKE